jgi:hypothetical protein
MLDANARGNNTGKRVIGQIVIHSHDEQQNGDLRREGQPVKRVRRRIYGSVVKLGIQAAAEQRYRIITHGEHREYLS